MPRLPEPPSFSAAVEPGDGRVRVRLSGELDLATVAEAEAAVATARRDTPGPLVLDLSALTFMDSSGMRLVMQIDAVCRQDGCDLTIEPGAPAVQRVFELSGVDRILPFAGRSR